MHPLLTFYRLILRFYRKCFWNSKSKLAASPNGDKSLVPLEIELEIEPAASVNSASSSVDSCKPEEPTMPVAAPSVPTYSVVSMHISFSNGMELSLYETDVNEITALLHKIVG